MEGVSCILAQGDKAFEVRQNADAIRVVGGELGHRAAGEGIALNKLRPWGVMATSQATKRSWGTSRIASRQACLASSKKGT